jgi:hypothetical protein
MKIGILGSGTVGQQLGLGFLKAGHEVKIGTRNPEKLRDWQNQAGEKGSVGSFTEAAAFGEMIVLATKWAGDAAMKAVESAGKKNFRDKIVIDVTNPLDFGAAGQPPKTAVAYPDSAGAIVQSWLPDSKVVKAFNIINAHYMADPKFEEGPPTLFICGDDKAANDQVAKIASEWGWQDVIDIGGIQESYLLEGLAMLWIRYGFANNYWKHAFRLMRK